MAANPTNIKKWFEEYIAALAHFGIQSPDQIWSGDENCLQNIPAVGKVLGHSQVWIEPRQKQLYIISLLQSAVPQNLLFFLGRKEN